MRNDEEQFELVQCTLTGNSQFVLDLVGYLAERLKFAENTVRFRTLSNDEEKATFFIEGFFVNDKGKPKRDKGRKVYCFPDIRY